MSLRDYTRRTYIYCILPKKKNSNATHDVRVVCGKIIRARINVVAAGPPCVMNGVHAEYVNLCRRKKKNTF